MYPVASSVDIDAYRLMRAGRLREALPLAERAVVDARTCLPAHGFLASLLLQLGRAGDAERAVSTALNLGLGGAEAYDGLAYVSMLLDRHDRANVLYRRAAELSPDVPRYWYNLACSERSLGNLVEAEAACDRCIALDTASYPTYVMRSELRVQAPDANHIVELRARLADAGSDAGARAHLGYALAKELDDVGHFEEAFRWFTAAAQARRSQLTYDVAGDEQKLRRIAEVFPRAVPVPSRGLRSARLQRESRDPRSAGLHGESRDPGSGLLHGRSRDTRSARCIFIVGLPRSGTTLVERILSGLAQVRSNGETDNVSRALTAAARGSGDMFARAAAADPPTVAAHYLRLARVDASSGWVIEKQPTNYLYLGAIRRALPDAKILLVRRAPLDVCFAMFRTMFGDAYPFTYDFLELARYYAAYDALVNHWRAVLGETLCEIAYEDLVREPAALGQQIARHCGLPWAPEAIDIEKNRSVSLTASASQVRRPIYGTSSGRWRQYRGQLEPLIVALRRCGVALPQDA